MNEYERMDVMRSACLRSRHFILRRAALKDAILDANLRKLGIVDTYRSVFDDE